MLIEIDDVTGRVQTLSGEEDPHRRRRRRRYGAWPDANWISCRQAARECGCSPSAIVKWASRGRVQARKTVTGHWRVYRPSLWADGSPVVE